MMRKVDWSTVMKLAIASLIVGTILGITGLDPIEFWEDVWDSLRDLAEGVFGVGWSGLKTAIRYTVIGAGVVIPIWLLMKLWGGRTKILPKDDTPKGS